MQQISLQIGHMYEMAHDVETRLDALEEHMARVRAVVDRALKRRQGSLNAETNVLAER